jgi:hypothetical protein
MLTEKQAAIAMSRCFHFNGLNNDACNAGVRYESLKPYDSMPCLLKFDKGLCSCVQRRLLTREEAEAEHAELEDWSHKLNLILPIIDDMRKRGSHGKRCACPICGGMVNIRIEPNGHARVNCETAGCAQWIE